MVIDNICFFNEFISFFIPKMLYFEKSALSSNIFIGNVGIFSFTLKCYRQCWNIKFQYFLSNQTLNPIVIIFNEETRIILEILTNFSLKL